MRQLAISYPAIFLGKQAWTRKLEILRAAVQHLTAKEVAHVLDVTGTNLSDALNERDRKAWHDWWTGVVLAMLTERRHADPIADDLLRQLAEACIVTSPFILTDDEEMTPEERAAQYRRALLK
jgi:hypothetical protein